MFKKCVSLSHSIYLTISSCLCLQNHRTWLTDSCLEREHPTAAAFHPGLVFTPADHNRTPKVGVFLTPSLASWWKHCSPCGEDPLAILVQIVRLGEVFQVRVSLSGMIGRIVGDQALQNRCVYSRCMGSAQRGLDHRAG